MTLYTRLQALRGVAAGLFGCGLISPTAKSQGKPALRFPIVRLTPEGFRLVSLEQGGVDGFNGGADELFFYYASARQPVGNVLHIALSANPKQEFASTSEHAGDNVSLKLAGGQTVQGAYHDGMWATHPQGEKSDGRVRVRWTKGYLHSLVFKHGLFTIGIRASVSSISRADLIRIAESTE